MGNLALFQGSIGMGIASVQESASRLWIKGQKIAGKPIGFMEAYCRCKSTCPQGLPEGLHGLGTIFVGMGNDDIHEFRQVGQEEVHQFGVEV